MLRSALERVLANERFRVQDASRQADLSLDGWPFAIGGTPDWDRKFPQ
jgi:hypothetical protein